MVKDTCCCCSSKVTEGVSFMPLQHDGRDGVDVLLSNQPGAERPLPVIVVALSFSFNGSGLFDSNVSTFFNMWKKIKSSPHVKTPPPPCGQAGCQMQSRPMAPAQLAMTMHVFFKTHGKSEVRQGEEN